MAKVTNFDELMRLCTEARSCGHGSKAWIEFATVMMDSFPEIYETAKNINERLRNADDRRLLRELFSVCEETEELEAKNDFERGRVFEAKGIRRAIGTWYQDEFCGRSFMGEPVITTHNACGEPGHD